MSTPPSTNRIDLPRASQAAGAPFAWGESNDRKRTSTTLSVIVPVYNERDSLAMLYAEIEKVAVDHGLRVHKLRAGCGNVWFQGRIRRRAASFKHARRPERE